MTTYKLLRNTALNVATTVTTVGALFLGWQAMADQNAATDDVPRLIPYHGTLEFNGQPVTATGDEAPWMQFEVYDGNSANAPLLYTQQLQVEVYNGQFTTALGPTGENNTSLEGVVAYADDLYLKLTLLNDPDDDTDDIALANSQRLLVAPFALWATKSADFDVANDLEVARDVGIGRNLNVTGNTALTGLLSVTGNILDPDSSVTVNDSLYVNGSIDVVDGSGIDVSTITDLDSINSGGQAWTTAGPVTFGSTFIVNGDISDSNSDVTIADGLIVTGNSSVTGNLSVTGTISDPNSGVNISDSLNVTGDIANPNATAITIADDLTVTGTIRGNFSLVQKSATLSDSNTNYISCDTGTQVISCGTNKTIAGDEDSAGCRLDIANNRCILWLDVSDGNDGTTGYCYCIDNQ